MGFDARAMACFRNSVEDIARPVTAGPFNLQLAAASAAPPSPSPVAQAASSHVAQAASSHVAQAASSPVALAASSPVALAASSPVAPTAMLPPVAAGSPFGAGPMRRAYRSLWTAARAERGPGHGHVAGRAALALLAYLCYKDGQVGVARELVERAAACAPNSALVYWVAGVLDHYCLRDLHRAARAYVRALTLAPGFAYAYYSLALLYADAGDEPKAAFLYRRCVGVDCNHHFARMNRALMSEHAGDCTEALEHYRHVSRVHPTCTHSHEAVARLLLQQGPVTEAEAEAVLREAEAALRRRAATALSVADMLGDGWQSYMGTP